MRTAKQAMGAGKQRGIHIENITAASGESPPGETKFSMLCIELLLKVPCMRAHAYDIMTNQRLGATAIFTGVSPSPRIFTLIFCRLQNNDFPTYSSVAGRLDCADLSSTTCTADVLVIRVKVVRVHLCKLLIKKLDVDNRLLGLGNLRICFLWGRHEKMLSVQDMTQHQKSGMSSSRVGQESEMMDISGTPARTATTTAFLQYEPALN